MRMSVKNLIFAILTAIMIIGIAGTVRAQAVSDTNTAKQPEAKAQAKVFYQQGQQLYQAGEYKKSIEAFEKSYKLFSHPNILYNIAKAYEKMAKYNKAIEYYKKYLARYIEFFHKSAPETADINHTIGVLKDNAYKALPEIIINSKPKGATIYIDDPKSMLGQAPFTTHIKPGTHKLWMKKRGYEPFETSFIVGKNNLQLAFSLQESKSFAFMKFKANIESAQIFVDGKVVGITPFIDKIPVKPGRHQVVFAKEGYNRFSRVVYLKTGQKSTVHARMFLLHPPFSWRGYTGISMIVLGAGAIAVSAFYFRNIANDYYPGTTYYKQFRNYTFIGYGVGSALVGAGTGLLIWEFTRKSTSATASALPFMPIAITSKGIAARISF